MMMAKKFGWIKDYDDWRKPRIVTNALELLEKEIPKYKKQIDFVHLSFMSDPFMYDSEKEMLIPEIKDLTLNIIKRLNKEDIKVTILTKGFYPDEILNDSFLKDNEYGITLVSLNNKFKQEFEPFSSLYEKRIDSLRKLHNAGLKTWISVEPYPTPNLDETAINIENILEKIKFVDKIIFGKLNYNVNSSRFCNNKSFYSEISKRVIDFCKKNSIKYHIKFGTPCSDVKTKRIFKEKNGR
jgi:DNA repair photolyase